ncbi:FAD dependent oxidoreductase [Aspergillus sclerotialis]|uniref:FAD dependent oxidoreductase n=1 Tax=Aspergillus sclerotialis TaxID=2070753 RepID=A0A3A2ZT50_9EURO|nr:FAD dependent oxidoreductase [Aspergillus sclerotialis]
MSAQALQHGNINLQTNTKVTSISSSPTACGYWLVQTDRGIIKARKVVVASNSYTPAILPEYRDQIIPYRAVACHIKAKGPTPLLVNTYALRFKDWDFDYLIPRPDGSIIVGGARSAYFRDKDAWYNNTNDDEVIEAAREYFRGYVQRNFRGWESSDAEVTEIWTGSEY